jgi:hypothetical protein
MEAKVEQCVAVMPDMAELLSDIEMGLTFRRARASRGQHRSESLKFAPGFKDEKLFFNLNFGDPKPMSAQRDDEVVSRKALKRTPESPAPRTSAFSSFFRSMSAPRAPILNLLK